MEERTLAPGGTLALTVPTAAAPHQKLVLTACGSGRCSLGGCASGEIDFDSDGERRYVIPIGSVPAGTLTLLLRGLEGTVSIRKLTVTE